MNTGRKKGKFVFFVCVIKIINIKINELKVGIIKRKKLITFFFANSQSLSLKKMLLYLHFNSKNKILFFLHIIIIILRYYGLVCREFLQKNVLLVFYR